MSTKRVLVCYHYLFFKLCSLICFFGLNPLGCNKYFSLLIPHMWLSVQVVWHMKQICSLVIWFLLFIEYRKTCEHNEICSLLVKSSIFCSPWFPYFLFIFVCWIPTQGSSIFANLNSSLKKSKMEVSTHNYKLSHHLLQPLLDPQNIAYK